MNRPAPVPATVDYPCSDGRPMAESGFQIKPLVYAIHRAADPLPPPAAGLCRRRHVSVLQGRRPPRRGRTGRVRRHWGGEPHAHVLQALGRAQGAGLRARNHLAQHARAEDQGRKREVYASLGVGEYWLFDPTGDWLAPRLQGFCLHEGEYRPLPTVALVHRGLSLHSEALGLDVRLDEEGRLRFHDPETGEDLPAHAEETAAHRVTKARLEEEAAAHRATEATS